MSDYLIGNPLPFPSPNPSPMDAIRGAAAGAYLPCVVCRVPCAVCRVPWTVTVTVDSPSKGDWR